MFFSIFLLFVLGYSIGSSHLHLQHLVENRLGQAFSNVSLVVPVDQLVSVLLVWNDAPTPADLRTATVSAGFKPRFGSLEDDLLN